MSQNKMGGGREIMPMEKRFLPRVCPRPGGLCAIFSIPSQSVYLIQILINFDLDRHCQRNCQYGDGCTHCSLLLCHYCVETCPLHLNVSRGYWRIIQIWAHEKRRSCKTAKLVKLSVMLFASLAHK